MSDAAYYAKLAHTVDQILDQIRREGGIYEPINWGDLHCVSIEESKETYPCYGNDIQINILIEEASPECRYLIKVISDKLFELGYTQENINIHTEW